MGRIPARGVTLQPRRPPARTAFPFTTSRPSSQRSRSRQTGLTAGKRRKRGPGTQVGHQPRRGTPLAARTVVPPPLEAAWVPQVMKEATLVILPAQAGRGRQQVQQLLR